MNALLFYLVLWAPLPYLAEAPRAAGADSVVPGLSFEDRVAAQKAIEQVYWHNRIWPNDNSSPKPHLAKVIPERLLRERVADYLRKSNALEILWGRSATAAELQAEMDRMARDTANPQQLRELFEALGNDAALIAQTLARQLLVERRIRSSYASDDRFHGELKRTIEAALATCRAVECLPSVGGSYWEATWAPRTAAVDNDPGGPPSTVEHLDSGAWERQRRKLADRLGGSPDALPLRRVGPLEESADAFTVVAVLEQSPSRLTTAGVVWTKQPFDMWWQEQAEDLHRSVVEPPGAFVLPSIRGSMCTDDTWAPTQTDAPDPRGSHTAVWTGTEMIVWGGATRSSGMRTGGRYNPATDTWIATSIGPNVPTPRSSHTAVWTGTEMIVWGGYFNNTLTNTGGRYDPSTDRWTPTSTGEGVPAPRTDHRAVWTGEEMIVWGGYPGQNNGSRYDPRTDTWRPISNGPGAPGPRSSFTAIWTGTEMIVWGGAAGRVLNTGARYDPIADAWQPTSTEGDVPSPFYGHTAAWTGTEMIVWGGNTVPRPGGRYDPRSDSWTPISTDVNAPAEGPSTAIWTGQEMIVWGPQGGRYRPESDTWVAMASGPERFGHTAVWTGTEMIVWGGGSFNTFSNTGGRYDPVEDRWTATTTGESGLSPRATHSAIWTGTEMIVWGGAVEFDFPLNSGARYTAATDSWKPMSMTGDVPRARRAHIAIWTGSEMILWGGSGLNRELLSDGARYDPVQDSWGPISSDAPVFRSQLDKVVWTGKEMIIWNGSGARYDPASDSWATVSEGPNAPTPRGGHSVVWTGTEMIVWGGVANGHLDDGSRYDPSTDSWQPLSVSDGVPAPRYFHSAVWTGKEMIVWGGVDSNDEFINTGGRYDPRTDRWRPISTGLHVPAPRAFNALVWTGREVIVWGGLPDTLEALITNTGSRYDPVLDRWTPMSLDSAPAWRRQFSQVWTGTEMIVWGGIPPTATGGRYCACTAGRKAGANREPPTCLAAPPPRRGHARRRRGTDPRRARAHFTRALIRIRGGRGCGRRIYRGLGRGSVRVRRYVNRGTPQPEPDGPILPRRTHQPHGIRPLHPVRERTGDKEVSENQRTLGVDSEGRHRS